VGHHSARRALGLDRHLPPEINNAGVVDDHADAAGSPGEFRDDSCEVIRGTNVCYCLVGADLLGGSPDCADSVDKPHVAIGLSPHPVAVVAPEGGPIGSGDEECCCQSAPRHVWPLESRWMRTMSAVSYELVAGVECRSQARRQNWSIRAVMVKRLARRRSFWRFRMPRDFACLGGRADARCCLEKAWVHGCPGALNTGAVGPSSQISPRSSTST
jgi:hypothetical protein